MCRVAVVAALATIAFAGAAGAQVADQEAEHRRGIALRNEHRDAEALDVFRGLYERTGEVRALARMALAEAAVARWVDAEQHLQRALSSADAWVAQNRGSLDAALETVREHLGSLSVRANVPGAEVLIGGRPAAVTPLDRPLRVPAGAVDVELRAARYAPALRTTTVRAGVEVTALDVELEPLSEPPHPAPVVPESPATLPLTIDLQGRRERARRRETWSTLSTAGLVLGGAGLLTSVIALGIRESAVRTFNDNLCTIVSEGPLVLGPGGRDCSAQYNRGEAATAVSITGLVAGTALAAAGFVAAFVAQGDAPAHAMACAPTLAHPGLNCGGRF
jgi:hypothetical protein